MEKNNELKEMINELKNKIELMKKNNNEKKNLIVKLNKILEEN